MDILQTLVKKGIVEKGGVAKIENEIESLGISLEEALIKRGVSLSAILEAKGEYFDIPTKNLEGVDITGKVLDYIPEDSAMHYRFVPVGISDSTLFVGMVDPDDMEAHDALNFISSKLGMPFKIFVITETDFAKVSTLYKGLSGEVSRSLSELETEIKLESEGKDGEELLSESAKPENGEHEKQLAEDAPVTKIVATLLRYAQDGRFTAKSEGRRIDFRVSTFPTYFGEKVVMRLLDKEKGVKKLDDIGMSKRNLELVKAAIKKPYGLILISGPTGSGKTTTLYSMLNEVDREHQNVLSLEDPIEYNIEGMSQSQVKPEIGYTFASGLRTTLRQDPDVIMVGEIRDKETAQLAIQAALTGHLVFSTIHTNSATGS